MISKQLKRNKLKSEWILKVAICSSQGGSVLSEEVVTENDLKSHINEVWREGVVRKGFIEPIDDIIFTLDPIFQKENGKIFCSGFRIGTENPAKEIIDREFNIHSLDLVTSRFSSRLISSGVLKDGDKYDFVINPERKPLIKDDVLINSKGGSKLFTVKQKKNDSIRCIKAPVAPLLKKSKTREIDNKHYPVFYTTTAFHKAEALARKGSKFDLPVETGAILVGILGSCPDSGELFAILNEIIELEDAKQSSFSLTPSGRTWQRLQDHIMQLRSKEEALPLSVLGQAHGHNFLPGKCESCDSTEKCTVSSAFVSRDDHLWNNAVFDSSPFQLCHIFGSNPMGKKVDALYGLENGRLLQRGFNLIPDKDLTSYLKKYESEISH